MFGFEALFRWQHPEHGFVPPGTFIPLAEQNGMIAEIGEWTLREACREAASWAAPLQIQRQPFAGAIPLRRSGGPRASVLLETGPQRRAGWSSRSPKAC